MFPTQATTLVTTRSWGEFAADLEATLRDLPDDGFVIVSPPDPPVDPTVPRPSLWRRIFGPEATADAEPYVQYQRLGNCLSCECGGPADGRLRGPVQITPEQQAQLAAIGWRPGWVKRPTDPPHANYRVYFPHNGDDPGEIPEDPALDLPYPVSVDIAAAAELCVQTMRDVFTLDSPTRLEVQRDEGGMPEGLIQELWRKRKERREAQ